MRSPADLGLPPKFKEWRKGQEKAVRQLLFSKDRFTLLVTPTGSGKSLSYMSAAMVDEESRALVLTSTRQLQGQLLTDFTSSGLTDIRGRSNYVCNIDESKSAADAVCTAGVWCERSKKGGCDFYDQRNDARDAQLVNSNYAFWLHDEEAATLGQFARLILDEAHKAPEQIERYAAVEVRERELRAYGCEVPSRADHQERWKLQTLELLERAIEARKPKPGERVSHSLITWLRGAKDLQRKIKRLCRLGAQEWLWSRARTGGWRWDLLDPGALAEDLLFRGAKRVVLASATVNKKTLEILGVDSSNVTVIEQDSTFPVKRRPVYHWPVARVGMGMSDLDRRRIREAIDTVVGERRDRKGLIHSVSYAHGERLVRESSWQSGVFILHRRGQPIEQVLTEFRRRPHGCCLVSPAVQEGVDFPLDQCEYQIIWKMPFPDMRDPLVKAKKKRDKDYIPYVVLQHVVQMAGRGMRTPEDQCETFILDGHFSWLRGGYYHYMPLWFRNALKTWPAREKPPKPLPKL